MKKINLLNVSTLINKIGLHLRTNRIANMDSAFFYIILICYVIATLFFASSQFFSDINGLFSFTQGSTVFILSFVIISSVAWESELLGPAKNANLFLHFLLIIGLAIFLAIALGSPNISQTQEDSMSILSAIWVGVKGFSQFIGITEILHSASDFIPSFIIDFFINWQTSIFLLLTLFIFCIKNEKTRFALLLFILFFTFIFTLKTHLFDSNIVLGILFLTLGITLHYYPYRKIEMLKKIIKQIDLAHNITPLEYKIYLDLTLCALEKPLSEMVFKSKIRAYTQENYCISEDEFNRGVKRISDMLLNNFQLLQLHAECNKIYYVIDPSITYHDSILLKISTIPRAIFAMLIALIWVLSPIDCIPDAIPFIGFWDDIVVMFFSSIILYRAINPVK